MRISYFISAIIIFAIFSGCSGGGSSVSTSLEKPMGSQTMPDKIGILAEGYGLDNSPSGGYGALGIFHGIINPSNLTGELVTLRSSALDDALEVVDITNFLTLAPCNNCVKLRGVELDADGHIVAKIGVKHPFPAGDPYKPISGRNRADLHVFNIEGTVIFEDSSTNTTFPGIGRAIGPNYLMNADGYSPYLDIVLDDIYPTFASIHPYKLHFDDYGTGNYDPANPTGFASVTDPPPSGNLIMAMGCDYDVKDYVFNIPSGESFEFIYAVGCTYAISAASKSQRFTPEYQVPQHNKKAASKVAVEITRNELKGEHTASSADLLIKVLDINHGVAVGDGLDQMMADSSVSGIFVEIPGVTSGVVTGPTTPTGGSGRDPSNPLTFPVTVENSIGAVEGIYIGLVKVTDSYPIGQNASPLLNAKDGIKRVDPIVNPLEGVFDIPEFATYQTFEIEVGIGNIPPVAVLSPADINICPDAKVKFDASDSTDLEDDAAMVPLQFEFDFVYDGTTFTSDTGAPSIVPTVQSTPYAPPGPYMAAMRVTDSGGLTDIATSNIVIGDGTPSGSTWTTDITDGSTIQSVVYHHTADDLRLTNTGRPYGSEGLAYGNGYVYLTFFAFGGNVYFTRSADSGQTWDTPTTIATSVTGVVGNSICANGSTVYIVYASQSTTSIINVAKNTNSGQGSWTTYQAASYDNSGNANQVCNVDISVDPTDSNYVYVTLYHGTDVSGYEPLGAYILRNSTGGSGTWTETFYSFTPQSNNGRNFNIGVNSDGSVYIVYLANTYIGAMRSDDHGATFTNWAYIWTHYWSAEMDMCFDPQNPDVVYMIWSTMGDNPPYGYKRIYLAKSTNRANSFTEIQSNLIHVMDALGRHPAIIVDQAGKMFVSYTMEEVSGSTNFNIWVRASCDAGVTFSPAVQFSPSGFGTDADPELGISPSGSIVLAWHENGFAGFTGINPAGKIVARQVN